MSKLKFFGVLTAITLFAGFFMATVAPTQLVHAADNTEEICRILAELGEPCDPNDGDEAIARLVRTIIDVLSIAVGAISVIMIIIGGLRYIISGGDSARVTAAKNTILYAIVGLVIVIFAQTIVLFVVGRFND